MRTLVSLLAWLAVRARVCALRARRPWSPAPFANLVAGAAVLGQAVGPNRAGRLVPVPDDGMEPGIGRSLLAHWALWAAVALILLALAAGYVRRRWKAAGRPRGARFSWLVRDRDSRRK